MRLNFGIELPWDRDKILAKESQEIGKAEVGLNKDHCTDPPPIRGFSDWGQNAPVYRRAKPAKTA